MKVCLVTAPTITDFRAPEELASTNVRERSLDPPLGILSLAAVLETAGIIPTVVDLNTEYLSFFDSRKLAPEITFATHAASLLVKQGCEIYGFSSICSTFPLSIRIAGLLKTLLPAVKVLFGGPQASVVDVQTLKAFPFIEWILRGEAEFSLLELLGRLADELPVDSVAGLTYRNRGEIQRNPAAPLIENLDALPIPAYHLTQHLDRMDWAALELGRGCPFACTFCSTNDFFRRRFRLRSPEIVLRDMRRLEDQYGVRKFELVHDMFTVDRKRVVAFCEHMVQTNSHYEWTCSARTDCVDEELLALMRRAGCIGVFYGVESGSERMQAAFNKHLDVPRARSIIRATEAVGLSSTVSLITGFPEETWEDVRCTVDVLIDAARCTRAKPQLHLLSPLAGTPLWEKHRSELLLGDVVSEMSSQGIIQDEQDAELIRTLPSIFPNFYHIPTVYVDRRVLFELHQFFMAGLQRFRWLIVALAETGPGIMEVFFLWHRYRAALQGEKESPEIRRYYRDRRFQSDFLEFAVSTAFYDLPAVKALIDAQFAMIRAVSTNGPKDASPGLPSSPVLTWKDMPRLLEGFAVLPTSCDLEEVIAALANGTCGGAANSNRCFYLLNAKFASYTSMTRISWQMAELLGFCDGRKDSRQIMGAWIEQLGSNAAQCKPSSFLALLADLQGKGLIGRARNSP